MQIYIYIDGFNLYYGSLKNTPYRWLDLSLLAKFLFPKHEIAKIKYFTAPIKVRKYDSDPDKSNRQQMYLRALKTIPHLEIHEGSFLSNKIMMRRSDGTGFVRVIKTEEKGTDVSLASHLLNDGHNKKYEMAVVISNDSDLVEPIKMVTLELVLPIVVVSPFEKNTIKLKEVATGVKQIRKGLLRAAQFPDELEDVIGKFQKPPSW